MTILTKPESDAVEAAYAEHVQTQFKNLMNNIVVGGDDVTTAAGKFAANLSIARKAKEAALAVDVPTSARVVMTVPKTKAKVARKKTAKT